MNCNNCNSCSKKCEDKKEGCLRCHLKGMKVSFDTVFNLTKPYLKNTLGQFQYYLCTNPKCNVAYYTLNGREIITNDILCDIWFKQPRKKFMVCYCRDISLDDVVFAVNRLDTYTIPKIVHFLQKSDIETNCIMNNPTGESCDKLFLNAIEYAKKIKLIK